MFPSVCYVTSEAVLGIDLWRVHGPARMLQSMGHPVAVLPLGSGDVPRVDVLVLSQRASRAPGALERFRDKVCRPHRQLMVVDCCDDPVTDVGFVGASRYRATGPSGHTAAEMAQDALRSADLVTVQTPQMARVCRTLNDHVAIVPDLIDGARFVPPAYERPVKSLGAPTIVGVAGGESHEADWRVLGAAWPRLAERFKGLVFACVGYTPDYLARALGPRLVSVPWLPLDQYQRALGPIDIGCAPLDPELPFNRSKSPIKWFEYSLAGAATVASPTVYGRAIDDGVTGRIAATAGEWVEAITDLLDRGRRERMVDAARTRIIDEHALSPLRMRGVLDLYARHHRRIYGLPTRRDESRRLARGGALRGVAAPLGPGRGADQPG